MEQGISCCGQVHGPNGVPRVLCGGVGGTVHAGLHVRLKATSGGQSARGDDHTRMDAVWAALDARLNILCSIGLSALITIVSSGHIRLMHACTRVLCLVRRGRNSRCLGEVFIHFRSGVSVTRGTLYSNIGLLRWLLTDVIVIGFGQQMDYVLVETAFSYSQGCPLHVVLYVAVG